ncbi:Aste57867_1323 [Aphanomyces stellatus]|uniref:Aste57867_1323 protein n=1 Tax=Aphanomyces stellatus TaxID=120398 RepID=A0A485K4V2_9STRA|nr:hypothetical protein As57867_001322 [Aphanomyces stellatus]VFT78542.1 Aste57867_1323 [Aphanomyces stellatus]
MGNIFGAMKAVLDQLANKQRRIIMLGLDAAGKTTILYKLKLNETVHTMPTIGFNVETFKYKNIHFTAWDMGGQDKLRPLWKHYHQNADAVIFVIDSTDMSRIHEAAEELHRMLSEEELRHAKVLFFINKVDLPNAMTPIELVDKLNLTNLTQVQWFIQACSAVNNAGLFEGMEWLRKVLV